ncbi:MAG: hypothetical protein ACKOOH_04265 [Cyanobium sp.]
MAPTTQETNHQQLGGGKGGADVVINRRWMMEPGQGKALEAEWGAAGLHHLGEGQ